MFSASSKSKHVVKTQLIISDRRYSKYQFAKMPNTPDLPYPYPYPKRMNEK